MADGRWGLVLLYPKHFQMRTRHCIPLTLLACWLSIAIAHAQNLVPNHSFEEYTECPTGTSQIEKATGWKAYGVTWGTPDFFHECSTDTFFHWVMAGVPNNMMGHQYAKDGAGYAGVSTYHPNDGNGEPWREVIGIQLKDQLIPGTEYYVSFWVSPGFGSYSQLKAFNNKTGARFSMNEYSWHPWDPFPPAPIDNFAHIYTDSIFTDTNKWHLIAGSFIADKPYKYLMLGNFYDNANTDTIEAEFRPNSGHLGYYYIDDVCVSKTDGYCYVVDTPQNPNTDCLREFNLYPNPTRHHINISLPCEGANSLTIVDVLGRVVHAYQIINPGKEILELELPVLAAGAYFIILQSPEKTYKATFILARLL